MATESQTTMVSGPVLLAFLVTALVGCKSEPPAPSAPQPSSTSPEDRMRAAEEFQKNYQQALEEIQTRSAGPAARESPFAALEQAMQVPWAAVIVVRKRGDESSLQVSEIGKGNGTRLHWIRRPDPKGDPQVFTTEIAASYPGGLLQVEGDLCLFGGYLADEDTGIVLELRLDHDTFEVTQGNVTRYPGIDPTELVLTSDHAYLFVRDASAGKLYVGPSRGLDSDLVPASNALTPVTDRSSIGQLDERQPILHSLPLDAGIGVRAALPSGPDTAVTLQDDETWEIRPMEAEWAQEQALAKQTQQWLREYQARKQAKRDERDRAESASYREHGTVFGYYVDCLRTGNFAGLESDEMFIRIDDEFQYFAKMLIEAYSRCCAASIENPVIFETQMYEVTSYGGFESSVEKKGPKIVVHVEPRFAEHYRAWERWADREDVKDMFWAALTQGHAGIRQSMGKHAVQISYLDRALREGDAHLILENCYRFWRNEEPVETESE